LPTINQVGTRAFCHLGAAKSSAPNAPASPLFALFSGKDAIRSAVVAIKNGLDWLPDPVVAVIILGLAVVAALAAHNWLHDLLRRLIAHRYPTTFSLFDKTATLTKLALITLAMIIVIPVAPLYRETAEILARLLSMAVIGLIGWTAIVALQLSAAAYLRRFRLDADDNFPARKHNTQVRILLRVVDGIIVLVTIGAALMTIPSVRQYGISLFASAGIAGIAAGLAARPVLSNLLAGVQLAMTQPIRLHRRTLHDLGRRH
jgi:small-conductance mechanosensitive channel